MKRTNRLTEGNILHTLIRFAVPVFFTLFLQAVSYTHLTLPTIA